MISLFFVLSGFITIYYNDRFEHHLFLLIPSMLIVLYGFIVGLSLVNNQKKNQKMSRIDTINIMVFIYSFMSLVIMLYKLKHLGGLVPDSLAIVIALSYLAICISTSFAGLLFHGLTRGIFKISLFLDKEIGVSRRSA